MYCGERKTDIQRQIKDTNTDSLLTTQEQISQPLFHVAPSCLTVPFTRHDLWQSQSSTAASRASEAVSCRWISDGKKCALFHMCKQFYLLTKRVERWGKARQETDRQTTLQHYVQFVTHCTMTSPHTNSGNQNKGKEISIELLNAMMC